MLTVVALCIHSQYVIGALNKTEGETSNVETFTCQKLLLEIGVRSESYSYQPKGKNNHSRTLSQMCEASPQKSIVFAVVYDYTKAPSVVFDL